MNNYIICPVCGAQYLPAEIFLPNYFLGKPKLILKNEKGIIENYAGIDMDTKEEFICDYCNNNFKINANILFKTTIDENRNYNKLYSSKLKQNKFELSEND